MPESLDRYVLHDEIASGGMGAVHLARLRGARGFARTVAIKRLHPHVARDPDVLAMFLDEAHLAARVRHPNVVATLDVVAQGDEVFLVMEYVEGESLSRLQKTPEIPLAIASAIVCDMLHGLHAAHEAVSERGEPLQIVHRDVSPQNILVGLDGATRVVDFGIAKAASRLQTTRDGVIKGKLRYMAPEQIRRGILDRRADIYSASVVAWETFAGTRMLTIDDEGSLLAAVLSGDHTRLHEVRSSVPEAVSAAVERGLSRDPAERFPTALEMATELERLVPPAPTHAVARWVAGVDTARTQARSQRLREIESEPWPEETSGASGPGGDPKASGAKVERARALSAATIDWPPQRSIISEAISVSEGNTRSWWRGRSIVPGVLVVSALLIGQWFFLHDRGRDADTDAKAVARATPSPDTHPEEVLPAHPDAAAVSSGAAPATSAPSMPASVWGSAMRRTSASPAGQSNASGGHRETPAVTPPALTPKGASTKLAQLCDPPYYLDDAGIRRPKRGCY